MPRAFSLLNFVMLLAPAPFLHNRSMYYVFDATEAALPSLAQFPNVCDLNIGRCHSIRGAALIRHLERHGKCIQRLTLVRVRIY